MTGMTEQDLVNAIIEYITLIGGVATRINSGMVKIEDSNGKTRVFKGAQAGTSDIIACIHGRYVAIECKLPGNVPTLLQQAFLDRVARAEGLSILAYSLEDAIKAIEEFIP